LREVVDALRDEYVALVGRLSVPYMLLDQEGEVKEFFQFFAAKGPLSSARPVQWLRFAAEF
jgi:hypothetical protein